MLYYLDTNVILDLIDGKPGFAEKLKFTFSHNIVKMSDIVYYEIMRGFKYKQSPEKFRVFMDFCQRIAVDFQTIYSLEIAAANYAYLRKSGIPIEDDDILIGSLAIANGATLVTSNTAHLSRLRGIRLEDWAA